MDESAAAMAAPALDSPQQVQQAPQAILGNINIKTYKTHAQVRQPFHSLPPQLDTRAPASRGGLQVPNAKADHTMFNSMPPLRSERPPLISECPPESEMCEDYIHRASCWRDYRTTGRVLGRGGLSTHVIEGVHKETGELVAIKTLEKEQLSLRRRIDLNSEIARQSTLNHPHIARLRAVYKSKKHVRLVMEHLSGGTVYSLHKKKELFSEVETAIVIQQVLEAVAHMHLQGVVHRDIKLENVVYTDATQSKVKLIDLGLATLWSEGMAPMKRGCGTPACVAPEVLLERYTSKADLWCVGVMAHKLLTGEDHQFMSGTSAVILSPNLRDCSTQARKFVTALLSFDDEVRPSAQEALLHKWLQAFGRQGSTSSNMDTLETLGGGTLSLTTMNVSDGFIRGVFEEDTLEEDPLAPPGASRMEANWSLTVACMRDFDEEVQEGEHSTSGDEPAKNDAAKTSRWRLPSVSFRGRRMSTMWASLRGAKATRVSPAMTQIVPNNGDM